MSTVLVTGGAGFIGSHTVDKLIESGYRVIVVDSLIHQVHMGKIPDYLNERAEYHFFDLLKSRRLQSLLARSDYILHLAALTGSAQSYWLVKNYSANNIQGFATIMDILLKEKQIRKQIKKIVYASSSYVYGEGAYDCSVHGDIFPDLRSLDSLRNQKWEIFCSLCGNSLSPVGVTEKKPIQTPNPYALSKYYAERLGEQFSEILDIPYLAFRYFNVYGARQSPVNPYTGVIVAFANRLLNNKPPIIYEDGNMSRDFVEVRDVAKANVDSIERGEGIYNLGTGRHRSVLEIAKILMTKLGIELDPIISNDSRPGDIRHIFSDNSKFYDTFGHYNFTSLEKGLEDYVASYRRIRFPDRSGLAEEKRKRYFG